MSTVFCYTPGCIELSTPDSFYCVAHQRARSAQKPKRPPARKPRPVELVHPDGTVRRFSSLREASEKLGLNIQSLQTAMAPTQQKGFFMGMWFRWAENNELELCETKEQP
jgi:hypothetical protein